MSAPDAISVEALPESLQEVAGLIGLPATMRIIERWGGTRLSVPVRADDAAHPLARVIGVPAMQQLSERMGGLTLNVPSCALARRRARDAEIRRRYAAGETAAALAREHGITERHVWRIVASGAGRPRPRQGSLFGRC